ncbi:MAG: hypothetical protein GY950_09325, partial [bacterium]|nr:hypothetical protein [bacterium]
RRSWDEAFKAISMLGIFLSFFIAFQGPWAYFKDNVRAVTTEGYLSYIAEAGIVDFLAIPLFFLLFVYLSRLMSGKKEVKLKTIFVNFSYCLVIIGLAIWAAFALGVILPNGSYILHILSDPFALGWDLFGTADSQWTPYLTGAMPVIQIILTLIGLLFALDYGFKFSLKTYGSLAEAKRGWIPMLVFLVLITSGFMWLFVG